ncbi:homoserine O-acetyltransferase [Heliobacterium gestii]|uniref:Homoserine O-acetyltransferase n=1 Tax=Heliomicrobium gestii TaxID=2699 RepID=A0A845LDI6_HELGE|nr:homoserine O-acetyltransferase [Heliomicrobium gestii]MBM7867344.1 homoserine O-acetyltransferase [Heliomicrobium gestii]MZP43611.1 homoserine O-acetyltransferase [Heliomicrobium gestii]
MSTGAVVNRGLADSREGLVQPQTFTFAEGSDAFVLESGSRLGPITVAYETYGVLNRERSNAILITHALTGDHHAAGKHHPAEKAPGWWDDLIGPGKSFDTNRFFIICSNVLGGCRGTTGPASVNPATGKPYGMDFPVYTVRDMVRVQKALVNHLGIERLLLVAGGSMGGMQVLEWGVNYPEMMDGLLPIATAGRTTAMGIAFNEIMRRTIMLDPAWNGGDYAPGKGPAAGLAIARMLGMVTYRTDELFTARFGRRMTDNQARAYYDFDNRFEIESYLHYQGDKLVQRFDANSYIYLCKAMDLLDVGRGRGGFEKALASIAARTLFIGVDSDWLYPPVYMIEMTEIMQKAGCAADYWELKSPHGHDAFLIEFERMRPVVATFVNEIAALRRL